MTTLCMICRKHDPHEGSPGAVIHEDDLVVVGHLLPLDGPEVYLGYLFVEPRRHVTGLGLLTDQEAARIGVAVNRASSALRTSEAADHVYSMVLGHGVDHLHVHVVAKYPGTPREFWGAGVTDWPDAPKGGMAEIEAVVERLRREMAET